MSVCWKDHKFLDLLQALGLWGDEILKLPVQFCAIWLWSNEGSVTPGFWVIKLCVYTSPLYESLNYLLTCQVTHLRC